MRFNAYCNPALPGRRLLTKTVRVMKITAFLMFAAFLHVSARGYSQNVTLSVRNAPLTKVFAEIKRQTGYVFFFDQAWLASAKGVTVDIRDEPLGAALDACFKDQPLTYAIVGKTIVIRLVERSLPLVGVDSVPVAKSQGEVEGVVLNEAGQPLYEASVTVKGTGKTVLTNEKGVFKIEGVKEGSVLVVTYVGFTEKQITFKGGARMEVRLDQAVNQLDRVQVIAYGTTTQRLNTGDVTTITASTIEKQPVTNPLLALEGQVPGMFITQTTGVPGSSVNVQIRGQNSMANGNDPLYIVDGVPYNSALLPGLGAVLGFAEQSNGNAAYGSPFSFINPADIESIEVLKDADATAIYGSRGANGVVSITTKKGKAGDMQVSLKVNTGAGAVPHFVQMMNTQQYLEMRNEAFANDGIAPNINNAPDLLYWDTTRYTNWQKALLGGTAHYTDLQGSISGGTANTQYYLGAGFHKDGTVFPGSFSDQKGSAHVSITSTSVNQKFKATFSGSFMADDNTLPSSDLTGQIQYLPPNAPPNSFNSDGTVNWAFLPGTQSSTWPNGSPPLAYLLQPFKAITDNLVSNAVLSYSFMKGLELKTTFGYTNMQVRETSAFPAASDNPSFNEASATDFNSNSSTSWIVEPQLNYVVKIGKGTLNTLLGTTFQQNTSNGQIFYASGFSSDALLQDIAAAATIYPGPATDVQYKYNAGFGRINYNWSDKYLVDLTARRDGSSRFGPSDRFHDFGSAGLAWIFSQENLVKESLSFLSFGKLRASYGTTGNDQIGDYRYYDLYSTNGGLPYEGVSGISPQNLSNPYLEWEEDKKWEGGLNLGFAKDRVLLGASYFRNTTSNELLNYGLPQVTGFNSIAANLPAVVRNAGIELTLNTINIKTKSFTWSTSFNFTLYKNKLVSFPGLATSSYRNTYIIGQSINVHRVFEFDGVNPQTGLYQFKDAKGADTSYPSYTTDLIAHENTDPKYFGGMGNSLQYKGFRLDIFMEFVARTGSNNLYNNAYSFSEPGTFGSEFPVQMLNRWQKPGDVKPFEMYSTSYGNAFNVYSSYLPSSTAAFTNASFIRVKNVQFSYELPGYWTRDLHLRGMSVYLQGQNLYTFTHHYVGLDPETLSVQSLPTLRVITGGVKVTL
jgi:TonB-dependent starch-binding outer membrane protein SusC